MSLTIRGNDFCKFFSVKESIIELMDRKWTQKSTLFAKFAPVILPFLGSKNSFSRLFRSCFGVVKEVFGLSFWT